MSTIQIKRISFADVQKCNFETEPHTVNLKKDKEKSEWWACIDEGKIVSVCCVFDRPYDKCFTRVFTPEEYRNRGYCSALIYFLSNSVYERKRLVDHCLKQSVNCFKVAGFHLSGIKRCKHGDLYHMKREGDTKGGKTEN